MNFKRLKDKFYFHLIRRYCTYHPKKENKVIYLTFDDGPEEGITEFVLDVLEKFNAKGTFLCCGKNVEKNPSLYKRLVAEGHSIGNHTYTHICGTDTPVDVYVEDVFHCNDIINTHLFRPPWGAINLREYLKMRSTFNILLWNANSGDSCKTLEEGEVIERKLEHNVKNGDVVLFHFCKQHEAKTKVLLPRFLKGLSEKGYRFNKI